jgi:hypothetical protein
MTPEFEILSKLPGVVGICYHEEHRVLYQNLPPSYGAATAEALSRAVSRAMGTYRNAERTAEQAYFQFPQCSVLVISSPRGNGEYLSILVRDQAAVPNIISPARAFLTRQH